MMKYKTCQKITRDKNHPNIIRSSLNLKIKTRTKSKDQGHVDNG